jgi:hypothetical protein
MISKKANTSRKKKCLGEVGETMVKPIAELRQKNKKSKFVGKN